MISGQIIIIIKVLLAAFYAGLIGLERESRHYAAGFRTHILVCIGATTITSVGLDYFGYSDTFGRIIPGILTGIGFLGAGTIFVSKDKIKGLTTAAGIWTVSMIGMVIGVGYFLSATLVTLLVLVVLKLKILENSVSKPKAKEKTGRKIRQSKNK